MALRKSCIAQCANNALQTFRSAAELSIKKGLSITCHPKFLSIPSLPSQDVNPSVPSYGG
jgi:hypothetical protein